MTSKQTFVLDPRLAEDCHVLGALPQAQLLLHRNSSLPWFILVPQTDVDQFFALPRELQDLCIDHVRHIDRFVLERFNCERTNFASIGNVVSQLHLHVAGRRHGDPCWPAPVWGNLPPSEPYRPAEIVAIVAELGRLVGLSR